MIKNKRVKIIGIICAILIGVFTINFIRVNADSGFDSSWDFGGSDWGGSSDWGSSDWGGSSWDYTPSGHNSHYSGDPISLVVVVLIIFICYLVIEGVKKGRQIQATGDYYSILGENPGAIREIKERMPDFDKEAFYKDTYEKYVKIQKAWMNFDYDELRKHLTDELYNTYKSQLKTLSIKKQKNIMEGFELNKYVIEAFHESEKEFTIKTSLRVKQFDYLVDQNNKLLRGTKRRRLVMTYELTFVKSKGTKSNKCPNCGASLSSTSTSNYCPYCKSTIVSDTHDWVLSKKEAKSQRLED